MIPSATPPTHLWKLRLVPLVLLGGLVLSLVGGLLAHQAQKQRTAIRFDSEVAIAQGHLLDRIRAFTDVLTGIRGLTCASGALNQRLLHDYLASMELQHQYRGLLAMTFGFSFPHAQRPAFERRMQAEAGRAAPFTLSPPGDRPDYFVVAYGEPLERNLTTIGFDTLTLPGQRASLNLAIDSGALVASAPMKVRQYDGPDPSLILRLAVYRPGLPTATPEQRRRAVYGVVNAVFRAQDLIYEALGPETLQKMEVWIEDLGAAHPDSREAQTPIALFGTPFPPRGPWPDSLWRPKETQSNATVGGRLWKLHFLPHPGNADSMAFMLPLGVIAAGLAVTGLLAGLTRSSILTDQRAQAMALAMTEKLQQNESRLQAITQAVPDLLFVLDEEGRYIEVHGGQDALLAAPRKQLLGCTIEEMLPPEVAQACQAGLTMALATHRLQTIAYELTTPAGKVIFEARLFEMGTRINGMRCVVVLARDITERSRAAEKLRMTQKLESLGVLAGGIAHDFNNLLTAILGNLNLAQAQLPPEAHAAPYLQRVETTVLRAAELAHQMLAYSGRGTFTVALLDLNRMVEEMTELLSVSITKKALLRFELGQDLPPILADAAQIQQVIMNLVINASEALGEGDGTIVIATGTRDLDQAFLETRLPTQGLQPGPHVTLTVTDTGCGMDAATLDRIFDPFFTTKSTGRGLGLSAMLGILKGHGAGISITSEPGAGATFLILFPASTPAPLDPPGDPKPAAPSRPLHGTVLVVDDEPMLRTTVASIVHALGMEAIEAADGVEALEQHAEQGAAIDLVLMDITMPRMDGNQAFLALRQRDPNLPVILSSGFTIQEMVPPPPGTLPAIFVQKPYRMAELKRAIQQALQGRLDEDAEQS